MSITNPAKQFAYTMKSGGFNNMSEEDVKRIAYAVNIIADLWHYEDSEKALPILNPLTLLANSLIMNIKLRKRISELENHSSL